MRPSLTTVMDHRDRWQRNHCSNTTSVGQRNSEYRQTVGSELDLAARYFPVRKVEREDRPRCAPMLRFGMKSIQESENDSRGWLQLLSARDRFESNRRLTMDTRHVVPATRANEHLLWASTIIRRSRVRGTGLFGSSSKVPKARKSGCQSTPALDINFIGASTHMTIYSAAACSRMSYRISVGR